MMIVYDYLLGKLWTSYLQKDKKVLTLLNMHYTSLITILHCLLSLRSLKVKHNSMLVISAMRH